LLFFFVNVDVDIGAHPLAYGDDGRWWILAACYSRPWLMFDVELCAFHVGRIFFSVRLSYELVELFSWWFTGKGWWVGRQTDKYTREGGRKR
jgi:hypothetical protein